MEELFDLYDERGLPTGKQKARSQVHHDGDWHRSVHLWVVRRDGSMLLQQRGLAKDTMPGLLTCSVGGHFAAGENAAQVLREALEEVGRPVAAKELIALGTWRYESVGADPGVIDREWQDVYFWPSEVPLTEFQPNAEELAALVELSSALLLALFLGAAHRVPAVRMTTGERVGVYTSLTQRDFAPTADYHIAVGRAVALFAAGKRPTL